MNISLDKDLFLKIMTNRRWVKQGCISTKAVTLDGNFIPQEQVKRTINDKLED